MTPEPPYWEAGGITLGRVQFDKTFVGGLQATSRVDMLGARTAVASSAGYVAMELVQGERQGKQGTSILQHSASMQGGEEEQSVSVVPDSATGELVGLQGKMTIAVTEGSHRHQFEYDL